MSIVEKNILSPDSDSSPERDVGDINNLRFQNPGGQEPNDNDDDDPDPTTQNRQRPRGYGEEDRGKEFRLVNPRNTIIVTFIGKQLQSNPYMKFNNQIGRLVLAMGREGEQVVSIFDTVEKLGNKKYTSSDLARFIKDLPEAMEYDRSVKAALLNWTPGIAQGLVEHGTECGFDAWRKLYNRYVPLAHGMQTILLRQLMSIKPVAETDMDGLFVEIERIREQYIKVGSKDAMSEKWIKAAILQDLPEKVVQTLAVELKKAQSVEEIYSTINTYIFDRKIGMPRGQSSPTLYLTEGQETDGNHAQQIANVANSQICTENKDQTIAPGHADSRAKDGQKFVLQVKVRAKVRCVGIAGKQAISNVNVPEDKMPIL